MSGQNKDLVILSEGAVEGVVQACCKTSANAKL